MPNKLNHGYKNAELNGVAAFKNIVAAAGWCDPSIPGSTDHMPLTEFYSQAAKGMMYSKLLPQLPAPGGGFAEGRLNGAVSDGQGGLWAVGYTALPVPSVFIYRSLIYHSNNGNQFSFVYSPNIDSDVYQDNRLLAVSALSPNDAWAVGQYWPKDAIQPRSLVMHWSGKVWELVNVPVINHSDTLMGVATVSPTDAWAVGLSTDAVLARNYTMIQHWDGQAWSIVPSPNENFVSNQLQAVYAASPNDIWAVGYCYDPGDPKNETLIMHNDGTGWKLHTPFAGQLYGISGSGPNDIWAVGYHLTPGVKKPLILHYDGRKWKQVAVPPVGSNIAHLNAVYAVSPKEAWAVGGVYHGFSIISLAMRWDGKKWSVVPSQ